MWILPNLTRLSLNFNKIEKIEHLEMLIGLKELNLSFNLIERIENLDTLIHLESLSLYGNKIQKIENLESLENLMILSIGNNLINTVEGVSTEMIPTTLLKIMFILYIKASTKATIACARLRYIRFPTEAKEE